MGTKRSHGAHHSPNRRDKDYESAPVKRFKNTASTPTSKPPPINPLKSKIRDLTRVLQHEDKLPADVRIEKERALAGYEQDLEQAQEEKRKQALIGRYHMVRFFERQKATRHLKKARRRLEAANPDTPEHTEALQDVHIAEVDLNYAQYCPLNSKYESIYPREATQGAKLTAKDQVMKEHGNGGEAGEALASRPAMWRVVENCMINGTLEVLREGKMTNTISSGRTKPLTVKPHRRGPCGGVMVEGSKAKSNVEKGRETVDDDESDGGFFEE